MKDCNNILWSTILKFVMLAISLIITVLLIQYLRSPTEFSRFLKFMVLSNSYDSMMCRNFKHLILNDRIWRLDNGNWTIDGMVCHNRDEIQQWFTNFCQIELKPMASKNYSFNRDTAAKVIIGYLDKLNRLVFWDNNYFLVNDQVFTSPEFNILLKSAIAMADNCQMQR